MKKFIILVIIFFSAFLLFPTPAQAACPANFTCTGGCESAGQCVGNTRCVSVRGVIYPGTEACGSAQLGQVEAPGNITQYNWLGNGGAKGIGLLVFISRLINFFVIICGIWTLFNFLFAGYTLISGQADSKAMTTVRESLTMTAIGLAIIAGAYILAGVIGLIFFGDATFILDPKITGALDLK